MRLIAISSESLKKHQLRIFSGAIIIVVGFGAFLFFTGAEKEPAPSETMHDKAPLYDVNEAFQSNPQPVLLRLVHPGSLPNKFLGKMRDCRIIAAASGELSTERAQFRLEKLSCIQTDGRVIETDVDGYVSGEDGKNGMRGRMVMRDAEVLKRGFLGGLLSGLGKATSQSFNTTSVSPLGAVSSVKGGDIFKQAGAEGAGNAFELMAKYNIQRAEQYQPVIQISAGREVFVIFHSGRLFGEHRAKTINSASQPKSHSVFGENP